MTTEFAMRLCVQLFLFDFPFFVLSKAVPFHCLSWHMHFMSLHVYFDKLIPTSATHSPQNLVQATSAETLAGSLYRSSLHVPVWWLQTNICENAILVNQISKTHGWLCKLLFDYDLTSLSYIHSKDSKLHSKNVSYNPPHPPSPFFLLPTRNHALHNLKSKQEKRQKKLLIHEKYTLTCEYFLCV